MGGYVNTQDPAFWEIEHLDDGRVELKWRHGLELRSFRKPKIYEDLEDALDALDQFQDDYERQQDDYLDEFRHEIAQSELYERWSQEY